jgi:ribose 5-phosphate isomerase B
MRIAIGSDHAGYLVKDMIVDHLKQHNIEITDLGCNTPDSVDYPDYAKKVCAEILQDRADFGILVCGTGIGMSMAANKIVTIRAALCNDVYAAEMTRKHNDANVLCLGARTVNPSIVRDIVNIFLKTEFEGGRHETRIRKFS